MRMNVVQTPVRAVVHVNVHRHWSDQDWSTWCCGGNGVDADVRFAGLLEPVVPSIPLLRRVAPAQMSHATALLDSWGLGAEALRAVTVVTPDVPTRLRDVVRGVQAPDREALLRTLQLGVTDTPTAAAYNEARDVLIVACSLAGYPPGLVAQVARSTQLPNVFRAVHGPVSALRGADNRVVQAVRAGDVRDLIVTVQPAGAVHGGP